MDSINLVWLGGEHAFRLPLGQVRRLQNELDAGPEEIMTRIRLGTWRVDDFMTVIRHGLIGGGMVETEAKQLVLQMFETHPLFEFKVTALDVIAHALLGEADDQVGEDEGVPDPLESGNSASSTAPAP